MNMARNTALPTPFPPGFRMRRGEAIDAALGNDLVNSEQAITATAGGTKAAAYPLLSPMNQVSVCATNGDSVLLPPGVVGSTCIVINDGAANLSVYGAGTDQIDGAATANATTITAARRGIFWCYGVSAGAYQWASAGFQKAA